MANPNYENLEECFGTWTEIIIESYSTSTWHSIQIDTWTSEDHLTITSWDLVLTDWEYTIEETHEDNKIEWDNTCKHCWADLDMTKRKCEYCWCRFTL